MALQEALILLPDEQLLSSSENGVLTLTTFRVIFDAKTSGASRYIGIPLDSVSSCGLVTRSQPWLLVLAALAAIAAFSGQLYKEGVIISVVAVIFLVALYFGTRRATISIHPNGGEEISVSARGMKREDILSILNTVMRARHSYLQSIANRS